VSDNFNLNKGNNIGFSILPPYINDELFYKILIYKIIINILFDYYIMAKSRKSSSVMKTIKKSLPAVNKGLTKVGTAAKDVADASIPIVEKGVSAVYGTMATGLDLGVKGVKTVTKGVTKSKRSRSLAGGSETRRCPNGTRRQKIPGECAKKSVSIKKSSTPISKSSKSSPSKMYYYIKPELLEIEPKQLKRMASEMAKHIKNEISELKKTPISKVQKARNNEYLDELSDKEEPEPSQNREDKRFVTHYEAQRLMQEEFLELLSKIAKGKSGKGPEFRLPELQILYRDVIPRKEDDFSEIDNYYIKMKLVILSNYDM
jgi:hypothetical protein